MVVEMVGKVNLLSMRVGRGGFHHGLWWREGLHVTQTREAVEPFVQCLLLANHLARIALQPEILMTKIGSKGSSEILPSSIFPAS